MPSFRHCLGSLLCSLSLPVTLERYLLQLGGTLNPPSCPVRLDLSSPLTLVLTLVMALVMVLVGALVELLGIG